MEKSSILIERKTVILRQFDVEILTICAGSSDCSRSHPRSRSASASTSPRCSSRCRAAGPTRPASRSTAIRRRRGSSKLTLYSADPHERWGAVRDGAARRLRRVRRAVGAREPRGASSSSADAADAEAWVRANRPDLRVMSAGEVIEIYKETGLPEEFARAFRLEDFTGHARARPHAHGDREPRHDRGLASVLDRPRPLPRPQRLALEPQPAAREPPARGDRVPDRERHRGRRRLPRVAAARGCERSSRRSKAASTTSTASTPSRSARRTASPSCATRSRASRPCSRRPTTGSRWRPSGASIAVLPGAADARAWEPEPGVVYAWEKALV